MSGTAPLGPVIAFAAGLLSFLSPCVLPLIPSYLTFITGMSLDEARRSRRITLLHAVLFIVGFTLIFLALGATASVVGRVLLAARVWIARIGGVLIILFGLHLMGVFALAPLGRERRVHLASKPVGYLGTVLVGIAFGAGWTPCIGPILGSILIYTSTAADLHRGLGLLLAYSLGLAVPFLLAAVAIDGFLATFARLRPAIQWMSRAGGALLVVIGALMLTSYFSRLTASLQALTPAILRGRL